MQTNESMGLAEWGDVVVGLVFLVPVGAILLGTGLLGEWIEWRGMALIACGLAAIDGRLVSLIAGIGRRTSTVLDNPVEAGDDQI